MPSTLRRVQLISPKADLSATRGEFRETQRPEDQTGQPANPAHGEVSQRLFRLVPVVKPRTWTWVVPAGAWVSARPDSTFTTLNPPALLATADQSWAGEPLQTASRTRELTPPV
jgi:hypothetical protein